MTKVGTLADFMTPNGRGVRFAVRDGTSDWNTCNAITAVGDEYHIPTGLTGWALDVGAHIGVCAVTLLVDNPELRVVAIEALPENVVQMRENLRLNGVEDRCIVIEGAAGSGTEPVRIGYGETADPTLIHEFIGSATAPDGSREVEAPVVTLDEVMLTLALSDTWDGTIVWAKLDCEGCEYPFLESAFVHQIGRIEGEVHFGSERLRSILEPTHEVTFPRYDENPDFGPFVAVRR